jgi:hypothetical protein
MAIRIRWREFTGALANAAAAWLLAARAQQAGVSVTGYLNGASQGGYAPTVIAFLQGLKDAIGSICDRRCGWGLRPALFAGIGGAFDRPQNNQNTLGEVHHDRIHRKDDHS